MSRIDELAEAILLHKRDYYAGTPSITDAQFDALENELRKLDPQNPALKQVGIKNSGKIKHLHPMLSIQKALTPKELESWCNRNSGPYCVTDKLDGAAISMIFYDGELVRAITRGDGEFGEDVTDNVRAILGSSLNSIPKNKGAFTAEIRGEVVIPQKFFEEKLSKEFSNPRNLAAGTLSTTPELCKERGLEIVVYEIIDCISRNQLDQIELLKAKGFNVPSAYLADTFKVVNEMFDITVETRINGGLEYQIDGIVVRKNNHESIDQYSFNDHHPKYSMCLKFEADAKEVVIKEIEWHGSRTGTLAPVAVFDPVELSGANVSRAALHNIDNMSKLKATPGATITCYRSGDVIPTFRDISISGGTEDISSFIPNSCPYCGSITTIQQEQGQQLRLVKCINEACSKRVAMQAFHWLQTIGVLGFGEEILYSMAKKGMLTSILDLYTISPFDISMTASASGISSSYGNKLFIALQGSIGNIPMSKFLAGLGIPRCAEVSCEKIAPLIHDYLEIELVFRSEEVKKILGSSWSSALNWLSNNKALIDSLAVKVSPKIQAISIKSEKLKGKAICITGSLNKNRQDYVETIRHHSGVFQTSVTKNTTMLLAGENAGSKLDKAKKLGTTIITEAEFWKMLS